MALLLLLVCAALYTTASGAGAADASATLIYGQPYDGRAVEGPSSKIQDGQPYDREVADDFDLNATITRVIVRGVRGGYNMPPNPTYYGVYVRFYDGARGTPGAMQVEHFLPAGTPGVVFDAAQPNTFDITLPSPFNAAGRHFFSVQPVFGGSETWAVASGGYPNVRGSAWVKRDRLTSDGWAVGGVAGRSNDMSFDLFGTLLSAPRVDAVSPNPVPRSGLVRISGSYFGAPGDGRLTIDGKPSQYIAHWSDNLIVAYVPESSALGDVEVAVTSSGATGAATLNVTTRPADGRIRWRFTVAGDYVLHRSGVGPDGTVYLNDVNGRLYALSPDGGLKWVFRAGMVGYVGPVTVGADGTIYVAGLVPRNPATPCQNDQYLVNVDGIFAVNPDGTQKWLFDKTCQGIIAGPNVGPDGKIYAVSDALGIGAFALNPDGSLAYAVDRFGEHGPLGEEIVFGPSAPGLPPTQQYFQFDNGSTFGYTLQGQRVFSYPTVTTGQPAVGLRTGSVYTVGFPIGAGYRLFALTPQGAVRWQSPIQPVSGLSAPDAPADESAVYVVQDQHKLHRVSPADGSVVWTFVDGEILFAPVASPDGRLALMGGRVDFGKPGFFEAVSKDGRQLWKQYLPDEPGLSPYGQVVPISRARFTADGRTAYIAADVAGDNPTAANPVYSFFYALDTSSDESPLNHEPTISWVSPADNWTSAAPASVTLTAHAADSDGRVAGVSFHSDRAGDLGTDSTADAAGNYQIVWSNPPQGTHSLTGWATDDSGNVKSATITITVAPPPPPSYTISGTVRDPSGSLRPGVTITLAGAKTASATTDVNGAYRFENLAAGGDYTVTASQSGYVFTPAARSFTGLSASQQADFAGRPTVVTRLSPAGDSYVKGATPAANYGSAPELQIKRTYNPGTGKGRQAYLRFDTSSVAGPLARATLRVYGRLSALTPASRNIPLAVFPVSAAWGELTLTWDNKPAPNVPAELARVSVADDVARWYEFDVTGFFNQERAAGRAVTGVLLRNMQRGEVGDYYTLVNSREAADNRPQLVVEH